MSKPDMALECDRCGACCRTFPVLVSIGDAQREPRIIQEGMRIRDWDRNEEWEFRLHPLPFHRGCAFLGSDDHCLVYETRPSVCRRFAAGSDGCAEARAREGLPALKSR